jgi:8-oxo-dGTP pyrophosphatase MutT (NUDIX family)
MRLQQLFEISDPNRGAGCVFLAADSKRILLAHRSREISEPGTYGTFGGTINQDETPLAAMKREMAEETGYDGTFKTKPMYVFNDDTFQYTNFLTIVPTEFEPRLNWESQGYEWCEFGKWPTPLHPGFLRLLADPTSILMLTQKSLSKKDNADTGSPAVIT